MKSKKLKNNRKYYNLLYVCTVDEAQQQIISMFDKVKRKKLTK